MTRAPAAATDAGLADLEQRLDRTVLVAAVRQLLGRGLPEDFLRACVRLGGFLPFAGGLKADMVGGLRVDVDAVLKVGDDELDLHQALMNAVNARRPRTFALVLGCFRLPADRRLLVLEQLRRHDTLLDLTFHARRPLPGLARVVARVLDGLDAVNGTDPRDPRLRRLPVTPDPYGPRVRRLLGAILRDDAELAPLWRSAGVALGLECPPLEALLAALERWLDCVMPGTPRALVHGDLHLGNVLLRRRGAGYSVRLIDPNPRVGWSDPLYDAGKLLHFAEAVGWAKARPAACHARWCRGGGRWRLDAWLDADARRADGRRQRLEALVRAGLAGRPARRDADARPRLLVATAAAHLGLAARLRTPEAAAARRFVLAHALRALAAWRASVS